MPRVNSVARMRAIHGIDGPNAARVRRYRRSRVGRMFVGIVGRKMYRRRLLSRHAMAIRKYLPRAVLGRRYAHQSRFLYSKAQLHAGPKVRLRSGYLRALRK